MFGFKIGFGQPWFLLLMLLVPLIWMLSYHSLAGLGRTRRLLALLLRSALITIMVSAAAEIQWQKINERLTVIYLLDQSASIPSDKREAMLQYVVNDVLAHRNGPRGDRVGVIVFGKEAMIEFPPLEDDIPSIGVLESARQIHTDATDLSAAMGLAQNLFREDTAKRIVIVTDGNENMGDARSLAPSLAEKGIGINVVPIQLAGKGEIAVDKVILPSDIRQGQPLEARISVINYSDQNVAGKLRLVRRTRREEKLLDEAVVVLRPGKNVFRVPNRLDRPDVYTFSAVFVPDDPAQDLMVQNNEATAFTHVRGRGRLLVIENWSERGEYDYLIERLRDHDDQLEVDVIGSDELFTSLAELQGYDAILLADVPRSGTAPDGGDVKSFSDNQIRMMVRAVEQMGIGLIMMGGPNSFGAGGWTNTELEKAMPVDFQIRNEKVRAVGALVLMMHASELAQGNFWQKKVAEESLKALGPMDYCGLVHWENSTGRDAWLWGAPKGLIPVSGARSHMLARLGRMSPGDMPDFEPAMQLALTAFNSVKRAAVKHMIIISDGDPSPPSRATMIGYQAAKIQISTVAIGTHGPPGNSLLQQIATDTGGHYYIVSNPQALPRIYQAEARKVSRPLVFEPDGGVQPQVVVNHEMHSFLGSNDPLPRIKGFVFTTVKDSQLVDVSIRSPKPEDARNSTILASWQYGRGRTVAFTTDAGKRWAGSWTDWENYDRFFTQMIRWAMRPVDEDAKITVDNEIKDGKVRVVVRALDKNNQFLSDLDMTASATAPDMTTFDVPVVQVAPGRYEAAFDAQQSGDYLLSISPGDTIDESGARRARATVTAGVTVPYSAEFRERQANEALLGALAGIKPRGGQSGHVLAFSRAAAAETDDSDKAGTGGEADNPPHSFQHTLAKAVSVQDVWPLFLLISSMVLFADILVRRVSLSWDWARPVLAWAGQMLGRQAPEASQVGQRLERLRSRKEQVASEIDQRRAATRFQPQADTDLSLQDAVDQGGPGRSEPPAPAPPPMAADSGEEGYTSRLRRAKDQAFKRNNDGSS